LHYSGKRMFTYCFPYFPGSNDAVIRPGNRLYPSVTYPDP
jgi:hypothetical protein